MIMITGRQHLCGQVITKYIIEVFIGAYHTSFWARNLSDY
jgi:hypothetical protein